MSATRRMLRRAARVSAALAIVATAVAGAVSAGVPAGRHLADGAAAEVDRVRRGAQPSREVDMPPGTPARPVPDAIDHEPDPREPEPVEHLRVGDDGEHVQAIQSELERLGYWLGTSDGSYGELTHQAVLAFQKAEGLTPDGVAGPETLAALGDATRPTAHDQPGDRIEIDLDRQLLFVVRGGTVRWTINTSTGRRGMSTPTGRFRVEREIDGTRHAPLGDLYRPKYFHDGYAVHGSPSVPATPASHGCARVSDPAMDLLWSQDLAPVGADVVVS